MHLGNYISILRAFRGGIIIISCIHPCLILAIINVHEFIILWIKLYYRIYNKTNAFVAQCNNILALFLSV